VGLGLPDRLAEGRRWARQRPWRGPRPQGGSGPAPATVSNPARARSRTGDPGRDGKTRVRGPGQKAAANRRAGSDKHCDLFRRSQAGHMADQGIEPGPALGCEDGGHGGGIGSRSRQAINRPVGMRTSRPARKASAAAIPPWRSTALRPSPWLEFDRSLSTRPAPHRTRFGRWWLHRSYGPCPPRS